MKKILIISPYFPLPFDGGGRVALFYPIDYLRKFNDITFVCQHCDLTAYLELKKKWPDVNVKVMNVLNSNDRKYSIKGAFFLYN